MAHILSYNTFFSMMTRIDIKYYLFHEQRSLNHVSATSRSDFYKVFLYAIVGMFSVRHFNLLTIASENTPILLLKSLLDVVET